VKVTIDRIGHHGDGIAMSDVGLIYAPGLLPGEVAEGVLVDEKLANIRIITPSTARIKPSCSHAKACGGCLMQHASDHFVATWKEDIVKGALSGQGLSAIFRPMITSAARSRRRATLTGRKTKTGALMGFHARGADTVIPVPNCQLLHPDLVAAFPGLEALVKLGSTRSTEIQMTVTRSLSGHDVSVTGGKRLDGELRMELARLAESHRFARLTWSGETVALRAHPQQRFGRAMVTPPPGAFLQATPDGEAALLAAITLALGPARRIADLFAGCGTFTLPLAEQAEVHAVEAEAPMMAALEKGARSIEGLKRITIEPRDLFRRPLEPDELKGFDAVVIDPPRAGAEAQMQTLAASRVPVIAAVSCNPITFARDARILTEGGYVLDWIQVIDQFRWSSHVELASRFSRPKA
jgi:23S rRNA (uracil1939-C5)-methyltransferase